MHSPQDSFNEANKHAVLHSPRCLPGDLSVAAFVSFQPASKHALLGETHVSRLCLKYSLSCCPLETVLTLREWHCSVSDAESDSQSSSSSNVDISNGHHTAVDIDWDTLGFGIDHMAPVQHHSLSSSPFLIVSDYWLCASAFKRGLTVRQVEQMADA